MRGRCVLVLNVFVSTLLSLHMHVCVYVFRTKALVLELLAAVCLVRGGHEMIIAAFNNFKEVRKENLSFSVHPSQSSYHHVSLVLLCTVQHSKNK